MKSGMFEIDGVEYPDADASDPIALGWMRGSPPPPAKLIRFQDDRFLEFPQIRWTLSHMRELAPTAAVWRGSAAPSDLGQAPHGLESSNTSASIADSRISRAVDSPGQSRSNTPTRTALSSCIAAAES